MAVNSVSRIDNRYRTLWRWVPGAIVSHVASFVIGIAGLSVLLTVFLTGVGLVVIVVGVPLIALSLLLALWSLHAWSPVLALSGLPRLDVPTIPVPDRSGLWPHTLAILRSGRAWAALLFAMVIGPVLSIVGFTVTVVWVSVAAAGVTSVAWQWWHGPDDWRWGGYVRDAIPGLLGGLSDYAVVVLLETIGGVICALTLPWVLRGLAFLQWAPVRALTAEWTNDALRGLIDAERQARAAAVAAEESDLRRLERDLHDGPQQRLLRLQMDLDAIARRAVAGDADAVAEMAIQAKSQAHTALAELRALSGGVAPPVLQDRGFRAALSSLAVLGSAAADIDIDPAVDGVLTDSQARSLYFVTAELLANVTKHAAATVVTVAVRLRGAEVIMSIADNGGGGAVTVPGHGLAGVKERVLGMRGVLGIDSVPGRGTTIQVRVPVTPVS